MARAGRGKRASGDSTDGDTGVVEVSVAGERASIGVSARSCTCVSACMGGDGSNRVRRKSKKSIYISDGEEDGKICGSVTFVTGRHAFG
jgi:hypothetical protein